MKDHRDIDERSLAFGRAIAERVLSSPELISQARATAQRWMTTCSPRAIAPLQEWLTALDQPIEQVVALLTSRDQRAIRLRQSNPFAGVLSNSERNAIIRQFESHDSTAA